MQNFGKDFSCYGAVLCVPEHAANCFKVKFFTFWIETEFVVNH